ncbi:MAG TPA: UDP-N-acetylmuramoyl-tripeptide--D-alanyl-D-alanine ligase, partial [Geobacteraceae bacterium]
DTLSRMLFTIDDITRATGGTASGAGAAGVSGVSSDSRTIEAGELFVALRGPNFDGHAYVDAAAARGARVFLVRRDWLASGAPDVGVCIAVDDTLTALGDLAAFHRSRFDLPVVGVTGSNGKTTTKEMLATILARTGPGLRTSGNLNNLIGLPRMLFQLAADHRWAVLEMGMSEAGEIDRLAAIARPSVGIITNALPAHLESMLTVENVARAKGELFLRLPEGGVAVYNADDPLVAALPVAAGVRRVGYGFDAAEVRATACTPVGKKGQRFLLHLDDTALAVELAAFGRHNISNALAAAAAAHALGVDAATIRAGLESFRPVGKRFNLEEVSGVTLIDDSYNANPASMAAALITLGEVKEECRAVAVLGDMLELGERSAEAHRNVGRLAASSVDRLYVMGSMATEVATGAVEAGLESDRILVMASHAEILTDLRGWVTEGDCILVKGSRGMGMEAVAEGVRHGFVFAAGKGPVT